MQTRGFDTIYDTSVVLERESIDYPDDTPYSRDLVSTIKDTGICDLSKLTLSAHSGTRVDSPAHFKQGGKTVDQYSEADFIRPTYVINIENREVIRHHELENVKMEPDGALLFKTGNSRLSRSRSCAFSREFVYLSVEVAASCVSKEIGIVGIDYITIEKYGDQNFPSHHKSLGNRVVILEGIDLGEVPAGAPAYSAFP